MINFKDQTNDRLELSRLESRILDLASRFHNEHPTEADCWIELFKRLYPNGIKCKSCQGERFEFKNNNRAIKCLYCKEKNWLTSGTFFHRVKSIKAWLLAIKFAEEGIILNSKELEILGQVSQSSAMNILKRINFVILSTMEKNSITCESREFIEIFCRRSRETPDSKPPVSEQEVFENRHKLIDEDRWNCQQNQNDQNHQNSVLDLSSLELKILDSLAEKQISLEKISKKTKVELSLLLASLTMLELNGLVERLPGDKYKLSKQVSDRSGFSINSDFLEGSPSGLDTNATTLKEVVQSLITSIKLNSHGVSRKYLQLYLAQHWYGLHGNREREELMKTCLRFRHITDRELELYVTPEKVKLHDPNQEASGQ